eukprot:TRINITY_DN4121_c0_g1_i1.p1 TRINITY_DN4121_c0_g1~~TRINITY_DN4121_c0_g1_i1.p1  ORF type:complete len:391 (+),score=106.60 TRINITY_DN4121_c0_g1_i1:34-1173(+)
MATRAFSNLSNLPRPTNDLKRVTRATRKVLGDITQNTLVNKKSIAADGKENVCVKQRTTKVAARRLPLRVNNVVPMEVEEEVVDVPAPVERVLPPGVKDIDEDDGDNPQLCAEYATVTYAYLKQLETRGAVPANYLAGCPTNDKMRAVLIDWLIEVQIQFKLLQETLFLTVNTIDRFMALDGKSIPRAKLQLVGVSAMFLVSKIEEVYAPSISDFVYITDNAYTDNEIRQMELRIIRALDFDLCQPISLNFLRRYSKAGEVDVLQHSLAKYALEVCLLDINLVHIPGSQLASASLCLSLLLLDKSSSLETVWTPTLQYYSGYTMDQVMEVLPKLATNVFKMNRNNKLQAVRTKYRSGKFLKVADIEELKSERLIELTGC